MSAAGWITTSAILVLVLVFGCSGASTGSVLLVLTCAPCAAICLARGIILAFTASGPGGSDDATGPKSAPSPLRRDAYIDELIRATQALYRFLKELGERARCRSILDEYENLNAFRKDAKTFSINPKLAAIAYCDLRDCFRKLGNDPGNLSGLSGLGFAMMVLKLLNTGFDLALLHDREAERKMRSELCKCMAETKIEVDIEGFGDEYRFAVVFGLAHGEYEWVRRYATLMYRWASLIAKADGLVTPAEAETLAAIMKMRGARQYGNIRITEAPDGKGRHETLDDALAALDRLIGLDPVKREVWMLANFIQIQRRRKASGLREAPISYHCVFTGNPGTGKTTVARILADVYRTMGVVKRGHLVETDRSGLVGEFVGHTAVKTNKIVDTALDGVLFVDEAYTLVRGGDNDYGGEAIATLLKRMEDDRDRLVVILAGYSDEMKKFIDSNPGLRSRFNRYIQFPDYTAEELARIFLLTAEKSQYDCNDDVRASLVDIMKLAVESNDKNFGNGRFVRNLFEKAIQRQAVRLSTVGSLTTEMLSELTLHDLGFRY